MMRLSSSPVPHWKAYLKKIKELFHDLSAYLNMNRLIPNLKKCKLMIFNSRPTPVLPDILFYGEKIDWVDEFKYLGMIIT